MAANPPQPAFALMPAQAFAGGLIDYRTREGLALFGRNTRSMYTDSTALFNAKPEGLQGFINHLWYRIREADWNDIFEVPQDNANPYADLLPFCPNHGRFTLEHLRAFVQIYMGQQGRADQDNFQAVTAIMASLSEDAIAKLQPHKAQYTVNGHVSAVLLTKVLLRESHLDTNATCRIARENLIGLSKQMKIQGYDIIKLNQYVHEQLETLRSRGEHTTDLAAHLMNGYAAAKDDTFIDFIRRTKNLHDENNTTLDPEKFMVDAAQKYKTLVEQNLWNAPSKDQAKLLALESKVKAMEAASQKRTKPSGGNSAQPASATSRQKETWMTQKPKQADIDNEVPKPMNGKDYYWCPNHERYVIHKPSACRGKVGNIAEYNKKQKTAGKDTSTPEDDRALKLASALQAEVNANDSDSD
jgi:hypothetical protein